MTLKQIASLGKELAKFLVLFVGRFRSRPGFALLSVYVQGLLLNLQRKNIEAMALELGTAPRTLQRFAESIKWDEHGVRDDGCPTRFWQRGLLQGSPEGLGFFGRDSHAGADDRIPR